MTEQPEALFLADELEAPLGTVISGEVDKRAAAELRRLQTENERLWKEREEPHKQIETYLLECNRLERERDSARAENERLGKLCDYFMGQLMVLRAEKQLREAIAKAEGGK
jgi:hypothetical protein